MDTFACYLFGHAEMLFDGVVLEVKSFIKQGLVNRCLAKLTQQ